MPVVDDVNSTAALEDCVMSRPKDVVCWITDQQWAVASFVERTER